MNAKDRFMGIPNEIIAITGDVAAGKTTRCKKLEELGEKVIYQDKLVRQIWETRFMKEWLTGLQAGYQSYVYLMEFREGKLEEDDSYDPHLLDVIDDMNINYHALRQWVFSSSENLEMVEHQMTNILPSFFYKEYIRLGLNIPKIEQEQTYDDPEINWIPFYYESATIYSKNLQHKFDHVEHITAPEEVRVKRIIKRDGCPESVARLMIKRQQEQKGN